ncbi:putative membrane protein, a component ofa putative secretion system [Halapricum desulfuricans]|uniref:Putative membrane protein, a component ofa putative secretion system n=1 Tax=Halapricum desulfuricans TaxID=2841257 RepID=A0A897NMA5_9EURY|nr:hypothetical protein [Halapricum desulfuricans]QSG11346.1 putative membrane protein, a component ofa putative secretion system [Halapricum desulfuricans]
MADPRLRFVRYMITWSIATIFVLVVLGRFSLIQFYVVSLIGFFVVAEVTATDTLRLTWRRRVRIVGLVLSVGFVLIVIEQIRVIVTTGA